MKSVKGFSMRSSCAPYKYCKERNKKQTKQNGGKRRKTHTKNRTMKRKKQFYFNRNNPNKSFDVYIDKNPNDTISIKYTTIQDVKDTIKKLERLYKNNKYTHKRIWQVAMIMMVRLRVLQQIKPKQYKLAKEYLDFLSTRTREKKKINRKKMIFRID